MTTFVRSLLLGLVVLFVTAPVFAQDAAVKIDGKQVYLKAGSSLPYWLSAGQTIAPAKNVSFLSAMQFSADSATHVLKFDQVLKIASLATVPAAKAWKIEAVAYDTLITPTNTNAIQLPANGNLGANGSGSSSAANTPQIYQSPMVFSSPGTYQWFVPPGVTNICVELWGGGGSGGVSDLNNASLNYYISTLVAAGGGGAGAYGYQCLNVIPSTVYTITVGAGGIASVNSGTAGGASSFSNLVYADGGAAGANGTPQNPIGAGGAVGVSNASFYAANFGNGLAAQSPDFAGAGGSAYLGGVGGQGSHLDICISTNGGFASGGGGGCARSGWFRPESLAPGNGGNGKVVIYW